MSEGRRTLRMTAFRCGLLAGLLAPVVAVLGMKALIGPELFRPKFNVEVVSDGASVSRHGGAKVVVRHEQGVVAEQSCRDACDDLQLQTSSGDNSFWVQVLDSAGRCVVCEKTGAYVTSGYGAPITRWRVTGDDRLTIQTSSIDRKPNGTFEEKPLDSTVMGGSPHRN